MIDNLSGRLYLIVYADPGRARPSTPASGAWPNFRRQAALQRHRAAGQARAVARGGARVREGRLPRRGAPRQEYIAAGDMMQVQVGQRQEALYTESPLSL